MIETDPIRHQIREAMTRILEGRPVVTGPNKFTVMDLVRESEVKRHYLTHRHKDLADEFLRGAASLSVSDMTEKETELTREVQTLRKSGADAEAELSRWRDQAHDYKRIIQVLVKERNALSERNESLQAALHRSSQRDPSVLRVVKDPEP